MTVFEALGFALFGGFILFFIWVAVMRRNPSMEVDDEPYGDYPHDPQNWRGTQGRK